MFCVIVVLCVQCVCAVCAVCVCCVFCVLVCVLCVLCVLCACVRGVLVGWLIAWLACGSSRLASAPSWNLHIVAGVFLYAMCVVCAVCV